MIAQVFHLTVARIDSFFQSPSMFVCEFFHKTAALRSTDYCLHNSCIFLATLLYLSLPYPHHHLLGSLGRCECVQLG